MINKLYPLLATLLVAASLAEARSFSANENTPELADDSVSAVIPSPNQDEYGDSYAAASDVLRREPGSAAATSHLENQEAASNEATVPVYVSPFVRAERSPSFHSLESSHAPPNYAPRPASIGAPARDLKASASYGHHHHGGYGGGHHGYDHSGWLDMGAWTGGKGSFGWYADYPVGKGHGYGRK